MAKNKPLVTIITPVYKNREYLFAAASSVAMQSYPNIQYIIVDDGPFSVKDEEILNIISQRTENPIILKIIHNEANIGTVKSFNKALKESKGKYIFNIADDDCFIDDKVISDWVDEFERTGAQIITAKRAVYDKTLTRLIKVEPKPKEIKTIIKSSPQKLFEKMTEKNFVFGCSTAKTKNVLDYLGGYDETYRLIEDYSFNMQALRSGFPIAFWNRTVIKYREGGISSASNIVLEEYMKEADLLFNKDILPYSKHPFKSKRKYKRWKDELKANALFANFKLEEMSKNKDRGKYALWLKFMLKHPFAFFIVISSRIKQWILN